MAESLRRELQQLSSAQLRDLLRTTGHRQLLRDEVHANDTQVAVSKVETQLGIDAKKDGNALFRRGFMHDAVSAYSRSLHVALSICFRHYL